jgi:hypothetical protein
MYISKQILVLSVSLAITGCSTTGDFSAGATALATAIVAPGNPDPDNKAYLDACVRQFAEQRRAAEASSNSITTALTSATDPATKASLVMLIAINTMQAQPFKCSVERRRGFMETFTADGLLNAALGAYGINRVSNYQKRTLESGDYRYGLDMGDAQGARQQINDLVGTKPDAGYTSRREADAAFINATPPTAP